VSLFAPFYLRIGKIFSVIAFWAACAGAKAADLPPAADRPVDFVKDVQPILSDNCFGCHGPRKHEAEVRWDNKEIALRGGDRGQDIIPGHSADSRLIQSVSGVITNLVMPQSGDRLTTQQIGILRAWIDQGANWPDSASVKVLDPRLHWSFKAPVQPSIPSVKLKKWARNQIDDFILARLEKEKLHPSPEADRPMLLRRLSLDLIGLPPTLEEIRNFVNDRSPDAYEKQVTRLLASPHFGECWARHWLDVARYADSNGYEKDLARTIWPYRDWVIDAYNRNLSYDQFVTDQLAGDMLTNSTLEDKVATGFFRNSMLNEEGGIDPEEFRNQGIIERMDVMGKAFLGLTLNCCQCHNHKYDPISQKEYYQFFAFLNNDEEPALEVPDQAARAKRGEIETEIAKLEDGAMVQFPDIPEKMEAWEKEMKSAEGSWTVLDPETFYASVGTKFTKLEDDSLLATGSNPGVSQYTVTARTTLKGITGFRLEALTDPNLPAYGPGRSGNGNFVL
jgi:mono/diheme cytochrome c family protein